MAQEWYFALIDEGWHEFVWTEKRWCIDAAKVPPGGIVHFRWTTPYSVGMGMVAGVGIYNTATEPRPARVVLLPEANCPMLPGTHFTMSLMFDLDDDPSFRPSKGVTPIRLPRPGDRCGYALGLRLLSDVLAKRSA